MTKRNKLQLEQAAKACNIPVSFKKNSTNRYSAIIGDKVIGSANRAMDTITSLYLKANK